MKITDLAQLLLPIFRQVISACSVWFCCFAICYQVMQQTLFLSSIYWRSTSASFHIFDNSLLTMSNSINFVYNLLPFYNQKLVAGSAQNLSSQALLSGRITKLILKVARFFPILFYLLQNIFYAMIFSNFLPKIPFQSLKFKKINLKRIN